MAPILHATQFPFDMLPMNNISAPTYRDGVTYTRGLEQLKVWINTVLVPEFNAAIDNAFEQFAAGLENAENRLVESETHYTQLINDAIAFINSSVSDLTLYVNGETLAARTYVDDKALESKNYVDAIAMAVANKTGAAEIQRATLSAPYTVTIDPLWPNNHPVHFVITQDGTGGYPVTMGANITGNVDVNTAPGGVTEFTLERVTANGWKVAQHLDVYVNVRKFGAKGNGTADDTAALNAAANSTTHVKLFIPAGEYRISGPIAKTGGSIEISAAPGAVIKPVNNYAAGAGRDLVLITNPTGRVVLTGLTVDGNSAALNGGAGFPDWTNYIGAITVLRTTANPDSKVIINDCVVYNFPSIGINVTGGDNVTITRNRVFNGMGHPIFVGRSTNVPTQNVRIEKNDCTGRGNAGTDPAAGGIGILVQRADLVTIAHNRILNMADTGTKTEGCNDVTYFSNEVTDSGKDGIKVQDYGLGSIFNVSRAKIIANTVRRINAWRTDGSGLIVFHSLKHAIITDNLLVGGGTRLEDAIRGSIFTAGNPFTDLIIENNNAINIASFGVRVFGTGAADLNANISVINNRLAGNIFVGTNAGGDLKVTGNTVHNDGVLNGTVYGINVDKLMSGTADISNNTISDHQGGVIATLDGGGAARSVRIAGNTVRDVKDYGARVANFAATSATLDVLEIVGNEFINTAADGTFKQSVLRIDVGQLSIAFAKIQNIYRQVGAGTFNTPLQIIGSTYPIGYMDYTNNTVSGTFTSRDINGEPAITRLKGYRKNAVPNWGTWEVGDYVENSTPSELGTAGAKYVIKGWVCVTAGSPGTWVQDRAVTGN